MRIYFSRREEWEEGRKKEINFNPFLMWEEGVWEGTQKGNKNRRNGQTFRPTYGT